ncbi:MAG: single-stranded-DNA-specific exonuclease RecJ, partial [Chloroflexi bacterium]|nr:single-stranded-DNA-specific exonuclease RecJ [Chloroflexota bacterium]
CSSQYKDQGDPFLLRGMNSAVDRIEKALRDRELIAVYGDYDVDGVTAATLLVQALESMGGRVMPYIPHRVDEGYGLNCAALETLAQQGATVVATVDCGIASVEEVSFGNGLGLDIIVTDHHSISGELPPAAAVINPKQAGCSYPFKDMAGVGVAFQLVRALARRRDHLDGLRGRDMLDLVALGTIADVVPLVGENRLLVKHGLKALNQTSRPGLLALIAKSGLRLGEIDSWNVAFSLAPRLNAAGRMDHASIAYQLLRSTSPEEASSLADELDEKNTERQRLTEAILSEARAQAAMQAQENKLLLLSGADWSPGVIGLVASRLVEEYSRPALVMNRGETDSHGSARSITGFNIVGALESCSELLTRYGGHSQAAGFSLANANLEDLTQRLLDLAELEIRPEDLQPEVRIDAEIALKDVTWKTHRLLEELAPFGQGNPAPLFVAYGAKVVEIRPVGSEGQHLRLKLQDPRSGRVSEAIGFDLGHLAQPLERAVFVDLVFSIEAREWNGNRTLQLKLKDARPAT